MKREHIIFRCEGDTLLGSLDHAGAGTGLLIVSGGNEIRSGAFGGQAGLARSISEAGFPVFRFDRRGVGDSEGDNLGFASSGPDIAAALSAFRKHSPGIERVVAFGNCDAASALVLSRSEGIDALVLSNPWSFDDMSADTLPPSDAIRSRYFNKLKNPREVKRLLTGKVNIRGLLRGIGAAFVPDTDRPELANELYRMIADIVLPTTILISGNDRTGQAFAARWPGDPAQLLTCEGASHAYAEPHASDWLKQRVLDALQST